MTNNVPLDVIYDILVRLSVKSLSRFKSVSKLWCFLISDLRFAKRHLNLAMTDKDIEHERRKLIISCSSGSLSSLYNVEYEAMKSNYVMPVELGFPLIKSLLDRVELIGSFNGLLCISVEPERIILFNPAINDLKRIPNLNIYRSPPNRNLRGSTYGFGYDHSIDDYNIVKIMYESSLVYVYSLKTDTWRRAQNMPYRTFNCDPGVPLNGAVHWVFAQAEHPYLASIVAFDFAERKFQELPRPSVEAEDVPRVGVLGGCLCWLTHKTDVVTMQQYFWVMKEYGVKESWSKVFMIDVQFTTLRPLSYLKSDEALLEIDGRLVIYNPREHAEREVLICGVHGKILEIGTYLESLVSPNLWNWELQEISDENNLR